ncbi:Nucleosome assembly protein [Arachis hypogaea]|nr:Nucleosome assembly protein [Arachis hypogaea]
MRRTQDLSLSPLLSHNRGHHRLPPGSKELAFLLVPSSSLSSLPSSSFFISFFLSRFEIVNGVIEVEGIAEEKTAGAEEDEEKGVLAFWLNAIKNNEVLAEEVSWFYQ